MKCLKLCCYYVRRAFWAPFSFFTYWTWQFIVIHTYNLSVSIFYSRIFFTGLRRWYISNRCLCISSFGPLLQSLSSLRFETFPLLFLVLSGFFTVTHCQWSHWLRILERPTGLCNQLSASESATGKGSHPVWVSHKPKLLSEYMLGTIRTCWLNESSIRFPLFPT